jgi:hypothetical protein
MVTSYYKEFILDITKIAQPFQNLKWRSQEVQKYTRPNKDTEDLISAIFCFCWKELANSSICMLLFRFGRFQKIAKSDY